MSGEPRTGRRTLGLLLGLTALGAGLRFFGLDRESLWMNELTSWNLFQLADLDALVRALASHTHPPGYYLLHRALLPLLGDAEWALRLPEAVFGTLAIPLTFLLGRRLGSSREGLIGAAFMALSWFPIAYSQECRPYSELLVASLLVSYFGVGLLRSFREGGAAPARGDLLGFCLAAALGAYLHYYALYWAAWWLLALGLAGGLRRLGTVALLAGAALALYAPWLPHMLAQLRVAGEYWIPERSAGFAWELLRHFFGRSGLLSLLVVGLLAAWLVRAWLRTRGKPGAVRAALRLTNPGWLCALGIVLPYLGVVALSWLTYPLMTFRNFIILLPAAYLLLARALVGLFAAARLQAAVAAVLLLVGLGDMLFVADYYTRPTKNQYREAVARVLAREAREPGALRVGYAYARAEFDYYLRRNEPPLALELIAGTPADLPRLEALIELRRPRHMWYLLGFRRPDGRFLDLLRQRYRVVQHEELVGAEVFLFDVGAPGPSSAPGPSGR